MNPVRVPVLDEPLEYEVAAFLNALLNQHGCPYVWPTEANRYSGKGLPGCLYPLGRDCSGTISFALRAAGDGIDRRADWNAEKYRAELAVTEHPRVGDLVVYVSPHGRGVHIEAITRDGRLFGALHGDAECTSPEKAMKRKPKACVEYRLTPYPEAHGKAVFLRNPLRLP